MSRQCLLHQEGTNLNDNKNTVEVAPYSSISQLLIQSVRGLALPLYSVRVDGLALELLSILVVFGTTSL